MASSAHPISGPAAARVAAQDAQIRQLVQQKETLEQTISQLHVQVEAERARGVEAVEQLREQWNAECKQWREACDSLQAKHRLAHLNTRVTLEHERGLRLEDKAVLNRERTASLLREYKITLFQARETELMAQTAILEDEVESLQQERALILSEHQAEISRLSMKAARAEVRLNDSTKQLTLNVQEKSTLETDLATLKTFSNTSSKQLERLALQIETLRTKNATLESRNNELEHQTKEWESLESRGGEEVTQLHKERLELTTRVKQLEKTLKESRGIEKKIAKLEASLLATEEQSQKRFQELREANAELAQAQNLASEFEQQVKKLKTALEAGKAKSSAAARVTTKGHATLPDITEEDTSEHSTASVHAHKARGENSKKLESSQPSNKRKKKAGVGKHPHKEIINKPEREHMDTSPSYEDQHLSEMDVADGRETQAEEDGAVKKIARNKSTDKVESRKKFLDGENEEDEEEAPTRKRKRKLNPNPTNVFSGQARFTWEQDATTDMGIPTNLSPVKEMSSVPPRATGPLSAFKPFWS